MAIFVTSDWHFGHDREFIWKPRGFQNLEEHDETIIHNHNTFVAPEDDVYVLGDLMLGDAEHGLDCIKRMNGKLHIVLGNHDTDRRVALYRSLPQVVEIADAIKLKYNGYHFFLCHYPTMTGNLERESLKQMTCNIFGHTHQKTYFYNDIPYMFHCGVDSNMCYPVPIPEVIGMMKAKVEECKSFLDEPEEPKPKVKDTWENDEFLRTYKESECDKCVWFSNSCSGPTFNCGRPHCPPGMKYKRDPPDGGYYG